MLDREAGLQLLRAQNPEPGLLRHALAAEAVLRALAARLGEDEELWGLAGLLHDLDYPLTADNPAAHGYLGADMLEGKLPPQALHAVRAHNCRADDPDNQPAARLDWALRCGETVTGLISAAALVRPAGLEGLRAASLNKKMKDKAFAASVCRETLRECDRLGLELNDFLNLAVAAMAPLAPELGLAPRG